MEIHKLISELNYKAVRSRCWQPECQQGFVKSGAVFDLKNSQTLTVEEKNC
jgi:hypothetical protein